jgi:hypothetical protein
LDFVENPAIVTQGDFGFGSAVEEVEDGPRKPAPRQKTKISNIDYACENRRFVSVQGRDFRRKPTNAPAAHRQVTSKLQPALFCALSTTYRQLLRRMKAY